MHGYLCIFEDAGSKIIDECRREVRFSATNFNTLLYFKNLLFNKNNKVNKEKFSKKIEHLKKKSFSDNNKNSVPLEKEPASYNKAESNI